MAVEMNVVQVAYIDLLGFTSSVRRGETKEVLDRYVKALEEAVTHFESPDQRRHDGRPLRLYTPYAVFSDSVFLYEHVKEPNVSPEERWPSLKRLIETTSHLCYTLLNLEQPFRGCITEGKCLLHEDRDHRGIILAGKPVVDAVEWEARLDWVGVILHPDLASKYGGSLEPCDPTALRKQWGLLKEWGWPFMVGRCDGIPLREEGVCKGEPFGGFAIVPTPAQGPDRRDFVGSLEHARRKMESMMAKAGDEHCPKYRATLCWYDTMLKARRAASRHSSGAHR